MTGAKHEYTTAVRGAHLRAGRRGDRPRLVVAATVVAVAGLVWGWLGWTAVRRADVFDDERFSIARWEATTLLNKWLYHLGGPLHDAPSDDEALTRYFAASRAIGRIEREPHQASGRAPQQAAELRRLRAERRRMENHVEAIIERRIATVLADEGLRTGLPGPLPSVVWPPVDFELTAAPRVLATSPRDRIRLERSDLLSNGLTAEEAEAVEARAANDRRAAVVLPTGGVAAYPSIVDEAATYEDMVKTAAHEWLHQYLFFHPLGRRYYNSDLRSVNETVATIGGEGIAELVLARYPAPPGTGSPPPPRADVDVRAALSELRREVEALLAQGRIEDAEALMERRRVELADRGVRIRRINQAYFAFRGLYATSGAAAGDLGPRLEAFRARTGSVGAFVRALRDVSSRAELDALLSR